MISLADSQVLRWIDELNGITDSDAKAKEIKMQIRAIKKEPNSASNTRRIRSLYKDLDELQFQKDYMCLIIDTSKDYYRACKGFSINGIRYKRLLGTNGGIKSSTIVFVSEAVHSEVNRRIENGRDASKELVTAKLEAYKALSCSASNPVSFPKGVAVVDDAETTFVSDIIYLTDENDGEPIMELKKNEQVTIDATDGFGIMLPSLAERWSEELGLDYTMCGANSRFAWEKGMVFTFDFIDFADKVAGKYIIKDAWGNDFDVRDVELILTTSMVKLWDSYKSYDDYITNSLDNKYTFAITKTCPKVLENERTTNYQFIQSYDLTDEDIDELIKPTVDEIKDVLGGDWRKSVLFLKGLGLNENNIERIDDDYIKAIMIDEHVLEDPFIQNDIYKLIKNRIDEAKVGVLKVHGNYSILSGDPYLLCQSMFGLEKTGLLKAGEIYNKYWVDAGSDKVACFRAPMSCHNNIVIAHPANDDKTNHWYKYMDTCTILNAWDMTCAALNGADFDGDLVMITDNNILVNKYKPSPALVCAQRKAAKCIAEEEDFVKSNIASFGNEIGRTTNWITSMFDVRALYPEGSKEYDALSYRIMCGQLFQQNAIDKAKGIICKPMPAYWHDIHAIHKMEDGEFKTFCDTIVANKKPYFMRYIYPQLKKDYNAYIKSINKKAQRDFGIDIDVLLNSDDDDLSDEQKLFVKYYHLNLPVSTSDSVMNKICRKIEAEFDGYIKKHEQKGAFNYKFMKTDAQYTQPQFYSIKKLYENYNKRLESFVVYKNYERIDAYDAKKEFDDINEYFIEACSVICSNSEVLCNIILDLCYTRESTKRFAWAMCGNTIINNLLKKNGGIIHFPVMSNDGDLNYCGYKFIIDSKKMEAENGNIE